LFTTYNKKDIRPNPILTEDVETSVKRKTLMLCELLQTTHPFKISFLLSKYICSFIQFIAFLFLPNGYDLCVEQTELPSGFKRWQFLRMVTEFDLLK